MQSESLWESAVKWQVHKKSVEGRWVEASSDEYTVGVKGNVRVEKSVGGRREKWRER